MRQSPGHDETIVAHLHDLLDGALKVWGVAATVTVTVDAPKAMLHAPGGIVISVTRNRDADGQAHWLVRRMEGDTPAPPELSHASAAGMLRGLRSHLQPDHPASRLVITPQPVTV